MFPPHLPPFGVHSVSVYLCPLSECLFVSRHVPGHVVLFLNPMFTVLGPMFQVFSILVLTVLVSFIVVTLCLLVCIHLLPQINGSFFIKIPVCLPASAFWSSLF